MENKVDLFFGEESDNGLLKGVRKLAEAVRTTMGPGGDSVLIETDGRPILTKDGVTVAKSINLKDPLENLGAQLVKEAASGAADIAGDGTTTATVLTYELFRHGLKMVSAGSNPVLLRKSLKNWGAILETELEKASTPIQSDQELLDIGILSANGEKEIGEFIVNAMNEVGRDGVITVEEAKGFKSYLDIIPGTRLNRGYVSPYFVNNPSKGSSELSEPKVLLVSGKISSSQDIIGILEKVHTDPKTKSLLIVANEIEGEALHFLAANSKKLNCCAIRSIEFGTGRALSMDDLALLLGTKVYSNLGTDITKVQLSDLGSAKHITVLKNETLIQLPGGDESLVDKRVEEIREIYNSTGIDNDEKNLCYRRLSRLSGGIAIIKVGGSTEAELRERKDRVDDALSSTKAAVISGYLPGGGTAIIKCLDIIENKFIIESDDGFTLLKKAVMEPLRQLAVNSGAVPELVIANVLNDSRFNYGYNARTDSYCDLIEAGIIDPTLVTISSLRHSVSAAINLLSTSCSIINLVEKE